MDAEGGPLVAIQTYIHKEAINLPAQCLYIAEELCIYTAQFCGIGPITRHLFGLWSPDMNAWLSPSFEINANGSKRWLLEFKLRFKPPSIARLENLKDLAALDYYFHQLRYDFLIGRIPEMGQHKNKALGLAATDMIREMLENHLELDDMKTRYKDFLPKELWKTHRFWLKQPLLDAVNKGLVNSKQNVGYVKEQFMYQVCDLAPDYGCEYYKAQIDEDGKIWEIMLQINPYHASEPGIRMQMKTSKSKWVHICSIEDLYYLSSRKDNTVEISRRNGIPQYVKLENVDQLNSFVSCLDGYYRLMEKWTFNLCKELPTPSLLKLKSLKCHGPVGYQFSYQKLKEKRNFEPGSFVVRESSSSYKELRVDLCTPSEDKPLTLKVNSGEEGKFRLTEEETVFDSLLQLVTNSCKKIGITEQVFCVSPSEYDKTRLLLCRPDNRESQILPSQRECSCTSQCIPSKAIIIDRSKGLRGRFTTTYPANLRQSSGDLKPIIVKALIPQCTSTHIEPFLLQCSKVMLWRSQVIVSAVGIILHNPIALVLESLPLGSLDEYLQNNASDLEEVDLLEATTYLATALWYLEDQNCCHGKIRCKNIMVSSRSENSFKVKLSDPGLPVYDIDDCPWIPKEFHKDLSKCQYSIEADVFAFGTTVWEIFSYGQTPPVDHDYKNEEVIDKAMWEWNRLSKPVGCHDEIYKLMLDCWIADADSRKKPQSIMRDVNQTLYEVYNSRRSHSYATVYPSVIPSKPEEESVFEPSLIPRHPIEKSCADLPTTVTFTQRKSLLKSAIKQVKRASNSFSYDQMSAYSGSSQHSTFTLLSEVDSLSDSPANSVEYLMGFEGSLGDAQTDNNTSFMDDSSPWVIEVDSLSMGQTLGTGFYGEVQKAILTQYGGTVKQPVAVKRIKNSDADLKDLLREINIMKSLRHKNIVEIKGLVEEPETMIVMEYLELGNLLAYLQMYRFKLGINRLLKFSSDIAEGMHYLEHKKIVHRDLASRNVLVASTTHVKISDFGLAQFTEDQYYKFRTQRELPIRWYSPESIAFGRFSHKSDVWSYGVTLWEIFSYGGNPIIPNVSDIDLPKALEMGQRLSKPDRCPSEVYVLMRSCWEKKSHERPNFNEIYQQIELLKQWIGEEKTTV